MNDTVKRDPIARPAAGSRMTAINTRFLSFIKKRWFIPAGIIVALIVIGLSFVLFKKDTQTTSAAWFSDEWHYRQQFDVFNASTTEDLIDFQVEMPTSTLALRTAWSAGKLRNDFKDLRFTDNQGNLLDYWFPDATSTMMSVYLKMPTMPKNATSTVMMYYGNPSAPDKRDGNKVFPDFFEDFSDGTYNTGRFWTVSSGTYSVAGTGKYLNNNTAGIISAPSTKAYGVWEFDIYKGADGNSSWILPIADRVGTFNASNGYLFGIESNEDIRIDRNNVGSSSVIMVSAASYVANSTWYRIKITRTTGGIFTMYIKGGSFGGSSWTEVVEATGSNPSGVQNTYTASSYFVNDLDANDRMDNILWRKFATTDPRMVATAGTSEETGGGPVGYWNFDGGYGTTAYDRSGSGNHGTLTNMTTTGTSTAWVTGKIGKALKFDGSDDYVDAGSVSSLGSLTDYSVSAWFNTNSIAGGPVIASLRSTSVTNPVAFQLYRNAGILTFTVRDNARNIAAATFGKNIAPNTWYHVVGVRNGNTLDIYLNGVKGNSASGTFGTISTNSLNIGAAVASGTSVRTLFFNGLIDEVKIYNYALTAAQIKTEYNKGASAKLSISPSSEQDVYQGLVGWWKMDESTTAWDGAGDIVNDYSGNGYHGTASGNAAATTTAKYGNAGAFDGTDDFVTVPSGATLAGKTQATISAWVKADDFGVTSCIYCEQTSTAGNDRIGLYVDTNGKVALTYRDSSQDPAGTATTLTGNTALSAATWYYITAVYDADTDKQIIYINGFEDKKATASVSGFGSSVANAIRIGDLNGDNEWDGYLDDVKVYSLARTADQIMQDYLVGPGPIAAYNFEEKSGTTLNDISGRGNNGTITAGASKGFVKGKVSRAYDFDGANTTIPTTLTSNTDFTSGFTISVWIKPDSQGEGIACCNWGRIVDKSSNTTGDNGFALYLYSTTVFLRVNAGGFASTPNGSITFGTWQHIVVTVSSNAKVNFYINGVQSGNSNQTTGALSGITTANPLTIGNRSTATNMTFDGLIDDLKIYNYALTPWQIAQEYNGGKPLAQWSFDEGQGTTAYNAYATSTNALKGTLSNMSTTGTSTAWVTGKAGKALMFDKVDDYVTLGEPAVLDTIAGTNQFTWSLWFKTAGTLSANGYLLSKIKLPDIQQLGLIVTTSNTIWVYTGNATNTDRASFTPNVWNHVVLVVRTTGYDLYLNGVKTANNIALDGSDDASGRDVIIGARRNNDNTDYATLYKGLIDEVKFYNYPLSPAQVKKDYNDNAAVVLGTSDGGQNSQQGLVGWWKMDEATTTWDGNGDRVNDYSGNGYHGTASGNAAATTTAKYGNAAAFDGASDYVIIGDISALSFERTDKFTIEAWFKSSDTTGSIFGKMTHVAPYTGYDLYLQDTKLRLSLINTWSSNVLSVDTVSAFNDNVWHHVAATYSGNSDVSGVKIYVDGVSQTLSTNFNTLRGSIDNASNAAIGSRSSGGNDFAGIIDDVKVYPTVRTPDQIMQDYLVGPGPIASYNFEEKSGATLNDLSGRGNNGTITAGASKGFVKGKVGRAYDFDGANTKIDAGSDFIGAAGFRTQAVSVSAWIYLNGFGEGNAGRILDNGKFQFYVNSTNNKLSFSSNASTVANSANSALTTGTWYYVTLTRNSLGTSNFYVNGVLSGTADQSSGVPVAGTTNAIIGNDNGQTSTFNGKIDDLKIYNYVLTPWQIAQEYNGGGPIGYWKMDEGEGKTIYDWSGKGNNGTLSLSGSPATSTAWAAEANCKKGRCLDFDGTDDYVNISDSPFDFTSDFSISAWVKADNINGSNQTFVCKAESAAYCLEVNPVSTNKIDFSAHDGTAYRIAVSNNTMSSNTWYHLVGVISGTKVMLYVNGFLQATQGTLTAAISTNNVNLAIGGNPSATTPTNLFNGKIDEVKIFNYALSPLQIREEYNAGFGTYFK